MPRIYLSAPHLTGQELNLLQEALDANWVGSIGPHVTTFEREFAAAVGAPFAVATSCGTAALHLALRLCGVGQGDEALVSSLTFCASVNPVLYQGARPVFIDSEERSWNLDPALVAEAIQSRARRGHPPKALVAVHLYGQSADMTPIIEVCKRHDVALIEDAAEALGASYKGASPGTFGRAGIFSFNGNKIITCSSGGMLVTSDAELAEKARKLATQARDPAPHYEHTEIGFNYRMSNLLAGVGRAQLRALEDRVAARRRIYDFYLRNLSDLSGLVFMPEAAWGRHTRWLTCIQIFPDRFGADRETLRKALEARKIESRPVWKPMHLQPVYANCDFIGGNVAERLFQHGLCLPSSSSLTDDELQQVVDVIRSCYKPKIHK